MLRVAEQDRRRCSSPPPKPARVLLTARLGWVAGAASARGVGPAAVDGLLAESCAQRLFAAGLQCYALACAAASSTLTSNAILAEHEATP